MVINYKQLRNKREQAKENFRRNEDLSSARAYLSFNHNA